MATTQSWKRVRMKHDNRIRLEQEETGAEALPQEQRSRSPNVAGKRFDPRCKLATQAFVSIPSLMSRAYEVCEISRSGMFLAFKNARSTWLELEHGNIELGTNVEIAFAVSLTDTKHRFSVRARIVRITKKGIGVQFTTSNPPQLAALREIFPRASEETESVNPQNPVSSHAEKKRKISKPSGTSGWQDWELFD